MNILIRYADLKDAETLAFINSESFNKAFKGIIPDEVLEERFTCEKLTERLSQELSDNSTKNSIMYLDNKPVGMMTFGKSFSEDLDTSAIEIWRIYLLPEYWNRKLGEPFMEWGIKELRNMGYKKVALWVIEENLRARRFYEKQGFSHDGVKRIINPGKEITDYRYIIEL